MKKDLPLLACILLSLAGCSAIDRMVGGHAVPMNATIRGVTYCKRLYGDLYPMPEQVGDIEGETFQEGIVYDDEVHQFRCVNFKGHDWTHSYIREYTGDTIYCIENEWDQLSVIVTQISLTLSIIMELGITCLRKSAISLKLIRKNLMIFWILITKMNTNLLIDVLMKR